MNPNSKKNQKLIKQYPFVSKILKYRMLPDATLNNTTTLVDDLTIRVEKADGDLMYRQADNIGLDDYSFAFQPGGKRKGQIMKRGEYLFAIDGKGIIINCVDWPKSDETRRKMDEIYGWSVLWSGHSLQPNGKTIYTDPIRDKVKYLVWVTVEVWHKDTQNDDAPGSRFGEFCDRSLHITIYSEPDEGFEKLQNDANVFTNLKLDSRMMISAVARNDHNIITMFGMISEMCRIFQDEVYFNGMKEVLDNGDFRGASGQFGSVKVLCAELCGYDRVMLEDTASYVTFQLRPDSKNLYVLGQQGTLPQIRNLVRTVVRMWNQKPELRAQFKPEQNVSVI